MKKSLFMFACLMIIFSSCDKEINGDEPLPKDLFTLKVDASYSTTETDDYVLLYDQNGVLLDYQEFEQGTELKFTAKKGDQNNKINVTLFKYSSLPQIIIFELNSYLSISRGETWTLTEATSRSPGGSIMGDVSFTISDLTNGSTFSLTDQFSRNNSGGNWSGGTNKLELSSSIYDNGKDLMLFAANDILNPRYKFIENVKPGDHFNFSMNDFDEFDKKVQLSFPATNKVTYVVTTLNDPLVTDNPGYATNLNIFPLQKSYEGVALGYLNKFSKYNTSLSVGYDDVSYQYSKKGSAPEEIKLPMDYKFSVTDTTIRNYTFTGNKPLVKRTSYWRLLDFESPRKLKIYWEVQSPEGSQKITDLPAEFSTKYPELSLDKLKYQSSHFETQSTLSYEDFINIKFKGKEAPEEVEYYKVGVY